MDPQLTQLVALLHEITLNNTVHINMTIRLEPKDSAKAIRKTYSKGRVTPKKPTAKMSAFEWNIENEEGSDDGGVEEEVTEDDAHPKAPLSVTTFVEDEDDPTLALVDSHSHEYQVLHEAFFRDTYDSAWPKKRCRTVDIQGRPTIIAFLRIQSECAAIDASSIMYPATRYSRSTRQRSAKPYWLFFGTAFWCNMGLSLDEDSVVQGQPQPCTLDMCRMCWIARAGKSEMELPVIPYTLTSSKAHKWAHTGAPLPWHAIAMVPRPHSTAPGNSNGHYNITRNWSSTLSPQYIALYELRS